MFVITFPESVAKEIVVELAVDVQSIRENANCAPSVLTGCGSDKVHDNSIMAPVAMCARRQEQSNITTDNRHIGYCTFFFTCQCVLTLSNLFGTLGSVPKNKKTLLDNSPGRNYYPLNPETRIFRFALGRWYMQHGEPAGPRPVTPVREQLASPVKQPTALLVAHHFICDVFLKLRGSFFTL